MVRNAALLLVDVQNDFCPGGALAVPGGDRVIEPLGKAAKSFAAAGLPVLASRDWHPPVTSHFSGYGGAWPPHCIQGDYGAEFNPALMLPAATQIISKGTGPDSDDYSAFDGRSADGLSLADVLKSQNVQRLYVGGLATDYCVRSTVLDALRRGFEVTVLTDAVAGVDINPGDSDHALEEMRGAGALFAPASEAVRQACNRS